MVGNQNGSELNSRYQKKNQSAGRDKFNSVLIPDPCLDCFDDPNHHRIKILQNLKATSGVMAAKLQQLDLQKLQVESGPIEMFMKFDEQGLKQSRS